MDDDIDIEEHDLLDNPAIKNMFPDLSILKKEISGFFEEAPVIKNEPNVTQPITSQSQKRDIGKKNVPRNVTPKPEKTPILQNKIILGSKPIQPTKIELSGSSEQDPYAVKVYVNNIHSFLEKSERFCKICLTVFPQKQDFEIHNMAVHIQNNISDMAEGRNKITIGSILKTYECNECSESFSQHSLLRRHLIHVHRKMFKHCVKNSNHTSYNLPTSSLRLRMVKSTKLNQCFHCKISFSSKKLLIEHIYKVLQSKKGKGPQSAKTEKQHRNQMKTTLTLSKRVLTRKRQSDMSCNNGNLKDIKIPLKCHREPKRSKVQGDNKFQNNILIFQCVYCSYIFSNKTFYLKHLAFKHKDTSITDVKPIKFDKQCNYCSKRNDNWKLHNVHMQMYHKQKIDKTVRIYPKICLPKCDQITPKLRQIDTQVLNDKLEDSTLKEMAIDFIEQLESIREGNEKEKTHSTSDPLLLKSILFKCKRCDIHFLTDESAMNHADHMELLINWKCLLCNKIFKKVDENQHLKQHNFSNTFTVLELTESQLARLLYKCTECAIHFQANGYLSHLYKCGILVAESVYCKVCDILIDKCIIESHEIYHSNNKLKQSDFTILNSDAIIMQSALKVEDKPIIKRKPRKRRQGSKFCFKLSYCRTCNSFISKRGSHIVHMESRCAHLPTYICKFCGLVLTNKTMATHQLLHKERKGIRLQDFTFYDIQNGKQILPPVPEYPECENCNVKFISKRAVLDHICNEEFLTCLECNIKLSEPVFKLHMSFHYYSKTSKNKHLMNMSEILEEKRPRPPPRIRDIPVPSSKIKITKQTESNCAVHQQITEKNDTMKYMDVEYSNIESTKHVLAVQDQTKLTTTKSTDSVNTDGIKHVHRKSDLDLFNVLYCCINCRTTIDTYDAVVEHCQNHLCGVDLEISECRNCETQQDPKYYANHKDANGVTNKSFELLEFDTFYFSLDYKIWLKHIFQYVDSEKSRQILNESIYKHCVKIKMQVIQEGSPDLTVYKCNSCFVIVDPDSLLKHVENSCFKTRKHPCSYCGLPFMSYMSLRNHLGIHKKTHVSLKSYRIVAINQENDKKFNKMLNATNNKHFLLYKCRNCNGVMDTYQRHNHTLCNYKDLKKCPVCNFMIYSADIKPHMIKHEFVSNYLPKNMKIVLFGQGPTNLVGIQPDLISFDGMIVDFSFFQCVKCGICLEKSPTVTINHHTCYDKGVMTKCTKCDLNILKNKLARHNKLHDRNVHFVKENINVLPYDHSEQLSKFVPANLNRLKVHTLDECNSHSDKNAENNRNKLSLNKDYNTELQKKLDKDLKITEKTAKLFKCSCGLHFLDKTSIDEHFGYCGSEKSKQHCSKCHLLFTPTALFSHLLLHHGDRKYIYNFNIIQMSKEKNDIVTLYNCAKCNTHFIDQNKAMTHFNDCIEIEEFNRKECVKCSLFFSSCSIAQHNTMHHDEKVAVTEIVNIGTSINNFHETDENERDIRSIDNAIEQADFVRESKYNISDENLSRIDLSRYSNTIFKCETCNTHFLTHHTYRRHLTNDIKHVLPPQDTCNICELRFSLQSLTKHIYIHHKQMKLGRSDLIIKMDLCN